MNTRRQQQQQQQHHQLIIPNENLDKIKHKWYHQTPNTLYSLCIETIVRNINLILTKSNHQASKQTKRLKYRLSEKITTLPNCISQSILKSYAQFYLEHLGKLERNEFFQIKFKHDYDNQMQIDSSTSIGGVTSTSSNTTVPCERTNLVTYYDLLLAFASRPDKIYLNQIEYRQCMWSSSTLEQRLRTRLQNDLLTNDSSIQQINTNYFRLYSASSSSENKFVLKSIRAQQPPHLEDKQLKLILKNQTKRCQYLDLCPCVLTNKSIHLINKCLKNLKYLRLQNCCDWSERSSNQNDLDSNDDNDENDDDEDELDNETDLESDLKFYFEAILANYNSELDLIDENEDEDDGDDTGEFDAYLEEYLNRYEKRNENEDVDMETRHKNKRRRHHHHHHHHNRHQHKHHHHHHHRRHKRNRAQNLDDDEILSADLELFLMSNNLTYNNSTNRRSQDRFLRNQHHTIKKRKELTKCKLFKLNKQARLCRKSLRNKLNQILNTKTSSSSESKLITAPAKTLASATAAKTSQECDKEANSLIKWLVQNTIKNTTELTAASSSSLSLIEQIRQRAALLAETKMIDKVSISSSNCDDNDSNKKNLDDEEEEEETNEDEEIQQEKNQPNLETCSSNSIDQNQSTCSSVYLSYDDEEDDDKTDKVDFNKSTSSTSSSSSCTSCSSNSSSRSTSTSSSSSSTDNSDTDDKYFSSQTESNPRYIRQQRLLDKVANLGSSPINVIQSIAAKALKFKLKNSVSFAQLAAQLTEDQQQQLLDKPSSSTINTTSSSSTSKLTTKYNRLLRQYKFFKSTHISNPNKATTSRAASNQDDLYSLNTTSQEKKSQNTLFSVFKYWMSNKRTSDVDTTQDNKEETYSSSTSSSSTSSSSTSLNYKPTNSKLDMLLLLLMNKHQSSINGSNYKFEKSLNIFTKSLQVEPLQLSNLQHLSLRNLGSNVINIKLLNSLFKNLTSLKLLDISNCCTNQMFKLDSYQQLVGLLDGLVSLKSSLTHLIMADLKANDIQANFKYILKMKQIKHLDISYCREKPPVNAYNNASLQLAKLVYHLTSLVHLDISGTNLGGTSIFKEQEEIEYMKKKLYEDLIDEFNDYQRVKLDDIKTIGSDVAGLMFLNNEAKMLDFFGCFSCDNSVSSRVRLPACRVAGEDCEKNLYTSLEVYVNDRPLFVLDALNHLFEAYRDELVEEKLFGGHLIMNTMEKNLDNSKIQISGSASLFYVLKYWKEENAQLPPFYLKRLIQTVINGMEEHIDEPAMRRNCVLIMCRLNLPDDVLFVSDRLIKILLKIFDDYIEDRNKNPSNDRQEHFVLRTAMHLLNILACSVHGSDKSQVGSQAIPIAMNLIKTKTKFKEADDILEVTWSFLWNITDETPENCKIFLDYCDGMSAFMECIQFKKTEITRNMMGLLGNVAEVKALRNRLCKNEYIATFRQLLFYSNDGIEIPYNSAGVLVHIMSDGLEAWQAGDCSEHDRQTVIEDIETAIDKWDLQSERNINYRSFEPIFRLVNQYDSPICQRWSCWALANLTTVYPDVYCPLFEKENGRQVLEKILSNNQVNDAIKNFSRIVLKNVDKKLNNS